MNKKVSVQELHRALVTMLALAVLAAAVAASAQTNPYKPIHQFTAPSGQYPSGSPVFDAAGNLYGVNLFGGRNTRSCSECGTAFKLSKNSGGQWIQSAIYRFGATSTDGIEPNGPLVVDAAGNLYGTTNGGGTYGEGTVFDLSPTSGGGLQETILYSFRGLGTGDGSLPLAGLVLDAAGNLYGTTSQGGATTAGMVFELSPSSGGAWTESVLYSFTGGNDGRSPQAGLVFDRAGNLYGTTYSGGTSTVCGSGCGVAFELSPNPSGGWIESVLHSFNFTDGYRPAGSLVFDSIGNLYGMTTWGGNTVACTGGSSDGCGVVYELVPSGGGWTFNQLLAFNATDGAYPVGNLIVDAAGNLRGTTFDGGNTPAAFGVAFTLSPNGSGGWTESVAHAFGGGIAGGGPLGLALDSSGNTFGMTEYGGSLGTGLVFEITN